MRKAPTARVADRYGLAFFGHTLLLAGGAWAATGEPLDNRPQVKPTHRIRQDRLTRRKPWPHAGCRDSDPGNPPRRQCGV